MNLIIEVIYQDSDLLVINKPADLLVHNTGRKEEEDTLVDWLLQEYPKLKGVGDEPETRPGIVHRLDKETSGVMVIAKNQKSFEYLKGLFKESKIKKTYKALVLDSINEDKGEISKPIGLKQGTTKRTVHNKNSKMIKEAITEFQVIQRFKYKDDDLTLITLTPLTGRTHQLRVHMNSINHPVLGDKLYGGKKPILLAKELSLERHFLHAETIEFLNPKGTRVNVNANLSIELERVLDQLSPVN